MILDALVGLYERLAEREEVAAEGWCKAKVSYAVNLSEEGRITGILPMKTEADRGKKKVWVPVSLMVPEMVTRSSGVAANFLCDNSKYILGIDANGTSPRVLECFQASRERHLKLLNGIGGRMAPWPSGLFFESLGSGGGRTGSCNKGKMAGGHRWRESDLCHGNGLCPGGSMDQRGLGKEPGENGNGNAGSLPGHRGTDRDRQDPPGDQRSAWSPVQRGSAGVL